MVRQRLPLELLPKVKQEDGTIIDVEKLGLAGEEGYLPGYFHDIENRQSLQSFSEAGWEEFREELFSSLQKVDDSLGLALDRAFYIASVERREARKNAETLEIKLRNFSTKYLYEFIKLYSQLSIEAEKDAATEKLKVLLRQFAQEQSYGDEFLEELRRKAAADTKYQTFLNEFEDNFLPAVLALKDNFEHDDLRLLASSSSAMFRFIRSNISAVVHQQIRELGAVKRRIEEVAKQREDIVEKLASEASVNTFPFSYEKKLLQLALAEEKSVAGALITARHLQMKHWLQIAIDQLQNEIAQVVDDDLIENIINKSEIKEVILADSGTKSLGRYQQEYHKAKNKAAQDNTLENQLLYKIALLKYHHALMEVFLQHDGILTAAKEAMPIDAAARERSEKMIVALGANYDARDISAVEKYQRAIVFVAACSLHQDAGMSLTPSLAKKLTEITRVYPDLQIDLVSEREAGQQWALAMSGKGKLSDAIAPLFSFYLAPFWAGRKEAFCNDILMSILTYKEKNPAEATKCEAVFLFRAYWFKNILGISLPSSLEFYRRDFAAKYTLLNNIVSSEFSREDFLAKFDQFCLDRNIPEGEVREERDAFLLIEKFMSDVSQLQKEYEKNSSPYLDGATFKDLLRVAHYLQQADSELAQTRRMILKRQANAQALAPELSFTVGLPEELSEASATQQKLNEAIQNTVAKVVVFLESVNRRGFSTEYTQGVNRLKKFLPKQQSLILRTLQNSDEQVGVIKSEEIAALKKAVVDRINAIHMQLEHCQSLASGTELIKVVAPLVAELLKIGDFGLSNVGDFIAQFSDRKVRERIIKIISRKIDELAFSQQNNIHLMPKGLMVVDHIAEVLADLNMQEYSDHYMENASHPRQLLDPTDYVGEGSSDLFVADPVDNSSFEECMRFVLQYGTQEQIDRVAEAFNFSGDNYIPLVSVHLENDEVEYHYFLPAEIREDEGISALNKMPEGREKLRDLSATFLAINANLSVLDEVRKLQKIGKIEILTQSPAFRAVSALSDRLENLSQHLQQLDLGERIAKNSVFDKLRRKIRDQKKEQEARTQAFASLKKYVDQELTDARKLVVELAKDLVRTVVTELDHFDDNGYFIADLTPGAFRRAYSFIAQNLSQQEFATFAAKTDMAKRFVEAVSSHTIPVRTSTGNYLALTADNFGEFALGCAQYSDDKQKEAIYFFAELIDYLKEESFLLIPSAEGFRQTAIAHAQVLLQDAAAAEAWCQAFFDAYINPALIRILKQEDSSNDDRTQAARDLIKESSPQYREVSDADIDEAEDILKVLVNILRKTSDDGFIFGTVAGRVVRDISNAKEYLTKLAQRTLLVANEIKESSSSASLRKAVAKFATDYQGDIDYYDYDLINTAKEIIHAVLDEKTADRLFSTFAFKRFEKVFAQESDNIAEEDILLFENAAGLNSFSAAFSGWFDKIANDKNNRLSYDQMRFLIDFVGKHYNVSQYLEPLTSIFSLYLEALDVNSDFSQVDDLFSLFVSYVDIAMPSEEESSVDFSIRLRQMLVSQVEGHLSVKDDLITAFNIRFRLYEAIEEKVNVAVTFLKTAFDQRQAVQDVIQALGDALRKSWNLNERDFLKSLILVLRDEDNIEFREYISQVLAADKSNNYQLAQLCYETECAIEDILVNQQFSPAAVRGLTTSLSQKFGDVYKTPAYQEWLRERFDADDNAPFINGSLYYALQCDTASSEDLKTAVYIFDFLAAYPETAVDSVFDIYEMAVSKRDNAEEIRDSYQRSLVSRVFYWSQNNPRLVLPVLQVISDAIVADVYARDLMKTKEAAEVGRAPVGLVNLMNKQGNDWDPIRNCLVRKVCAEMLIDEQLVAASQDEFSKWLLAYFRGENPAATNRGEHEANLLVLQKILRECQAGIYPRELAKIIGAGDANRASIFIAATEYFNRPENKQLTAENRIFASFVFEILSLQDEYVKIKNSDKARLDGLRHSVAPIIGALRFAKVDTALSLLSSGDEENISDGSGLVLAQQFMRDSVELLASIKGAASNKNEVEEYVKSRFDDSAKRKEFCDASVETEITVCQASFLDSIRRIIKDDNCVTKLRNSSLRKLFDAFPKYYVTIPVSRDKPPYLNLHKARFESLFNTPERVLAVMSIYRAFVEKKDFSELAFINFIDTLKEKDIALTELFDVMMVFQSEEDKLAQAYHLQSFVDKNKESIVSHNLQLLIKALNFKESSANTFEQEEFRLTTLQWRGTEFFKFEEVLLAAIKNFQDRNLQNMSVSENEKIFMDEASDVLVEMMMREDGSKKRFSAFWEAKITDLLEKPEQNGLGVAVALLGILDKDSKQRVEDKMRGKQDLAAEQAFALIKFFNAGNTNDESLTSFVQKNLLSVLQAKGLSEDVSQLDFSAQLIKWLELIDFRVLEKSSWLSLLNASEKAPKITETSTRPLVSFMVALFTKLDIESDKSDAEIHQKVGRIREPLQIMAANLLAHDIHAFLTQSFEVQKANDLLRRFYVSGLPTNTLLDLGKAFVAYLDKTEQPSTAESLAFISQICAGVENDIKATALLREQFNRVQEKLLINESILILNELQSFVKGDLQENEIILARLAKVNLANIKKLPEGLFSALQVAVRDKVNNEHQFTFMQKILTKITEKLNQNPELVQEKGALAEIEASLKAKKEMAETLAMQVQMLLADVPFDLQKEERLVNQVKQVALGLVESNFWHGVVAHSPKADVIASRAEFEGIGRLMSVLAQQLKPNPEAKAIVADQYRVLEDAENKAKKSLEEIAQFLLTGINSKDKEVFASQIKKLTAINFALVPENIIQATISSTLGVVAFSIEDRGASVEFTNFMAKVLRILSKKDSPSLTGKIEKLREHVEELLHNIRRNFNRHVANGVYFANNEEPLSKEKKVNELQYEYHVARAFGNEAERREAKNLFLNYARWLWFDAVDHNFRTNPKAERYVSALEGLGHPLAEEIVTLHRNLSRNNSRKEIDKCRAMQPPLTQMRARYVDWRNSLSVHIYEKAIKYLQEQGWTEGRAKGIVDDYLIPLRDFLVANTRKQQQLLIDQARFEEGLPEDIASCWRALKATFKDKVEQLNCLITSIHLSASIILVSRTAASFEEFIDGIELVGAELSYSDLAPLQLDPSYVATLENIRDKTTAYRDASPTEDGNVKKLPKSPKDRQSYVLNTRINYAKRVLSDAAQAFAEVERGHILFELRMIQAADPQLYIDKLFDKHELYIKSMIDKMQDDPMMMNNLKDIVINHLQFIQEAAPEKYKAAFTHVAFGELGTIVADLQASKGFYDSMVKMLQKYIQKTSEASDLDFLAKKEFHLVFSDKQASTLRQMITLFPSDLRRRFESIIDGADLLKAGTGVFTVQDQEGFIRALKAQMSEQTILTKAYDVILTFSRALNSAAYDQRVSAEVNEDMLFEKFAETLDKVDIKNPQHVEAFVTHFEDMLGLVSTFPGLAVYLKECLHLLIQDIDLNNFLKIFPVIEKAIRGKRVLQEVLEPGQLFAQKVQLLLAQSGNLSTVIGIGSYCQSLVGQTPEEFLVNNEILREFLRDSVSEKLKVLHDIYSQYSNAVKRTEQDRLLPLFGVEKFADIYSVLKESYLKYCMHPQCIPHLTMSNLTDIVSMLDFRESFDLSVFAQLMSIASTSVRDDIKRQLYAALQDNLTRFLGGCDLTMFKNLYAHVQSLIHENKVNVEILAAMNHKAHELLLGVSGFTNIVAECDVFKPLVSTLPEALRRKEADTALTSALDMLTHIEKGHDRGSFAGCNGDGENFVRKLKANITDVFWYGTLAQQKKLLDEVQAKYQLAQAWESGSKDKKRGGKLSERLDASLTSAPRFKPNSPSSQALFNVYKTQAYDEFNLAYLQVCFNKARWSDFNSAEQAELKSQANIYIQALTRNFIGQALLNQAKRCVFLFEHVDEVVKKQLADKIARHVVQLEDAIVVRELWQQLTTDEIRLATKQQALTSLTSNTLNFDNSYAAAVKVFLTGTELDQLKALHYVYKTLSPTQTVEMDAFAGISNPEVIFKDFYLNYCMQAKDLHAANIVDLLSLLDLSRSEDLHHLEKMLTIIDSSHSAENIRLDLKRGIYEELNQIITNKDAKNSEIFRNILAARQLIDGDLPAFKEFVRHYSMVFQNQEDNRLEAEVKTLADAAMLNDDWQMYLVGDKEKIVVKAMEILMEGIPSGEMSVSSMLKLFMVGRDNEKIQLLKLIAIPENFRRLEQNPATSRVLATLLGKSSQDSLLDCFREFCLDACLTAVLKAKEDLSPKLIFELINNLTDLTISFTTQSKLRPASVVTALTNLSNQIKTLIGGLYIRAQSDESKKQFLLVLDGKVSESEVVDEAKNRRLSKLLDTITHHINTIGSSDAALFKPKPTVVKPVVELLPAAMPSVSSLERTPSPDTDSTASETQYGTQQRLKSITRTPKKMSSMDKHNLIILGDQCWQRARSQEQPMGAWLKSSSSGELSTPSPTASRSRKILFGSST